jgi:hypothetical protein
MLLECLTGRREYEGASLEVAMARLNRQPEIPADLSAGWRDLLIGMTARAPSARLSAPQVVDRLTRISAGDDRTASMSIPAPTPDPPTMVMPMATTVMPRAAAPEPTPTAPPPYRRRRSPWPAVLLLVLLIAAGAVVGVVLVDRNQNNSGGSGAGCVAGTPGLAGRLETDMRHLERLTCR